MAIYDLLILLCCGTGNTALVRIVNIFTLISIQVHSKKADYSAQPKENRRIKNDNVTCILLNIYTLIERIYVVKQLIGWV